MTEPDKEDQLLETIIELGNEAGATAEAFKKSIAADGTVSLVVLTRALSDALGLVADLAGATGGAHREHYEWAGEVDAQLDEIEAQLGGASVLLSEDAEKLKGAILALVKELRPGDDAALTAVRVAAAEAVAFIDSITEDPDDNEDPEHPDES